MANREKDEPRKDEDEEDVSPMAGMSEPMTEEEVDDENAPTGEES